MAVNSADPWIVDFQPTAVVPRLVPTATIFKVPTHLWKSQSPDDDYFKVHMLELGLHNRTPTPDTREKLKVHNLKLQIAYVLHQKLVSSSNPPGNIIRSWDDFTNVIVADVNLARGQYEEPVPMSDAGVQKQLALDALFIVFYFQYCNSRRFNMKEFTSLAKVNAATLNSIGVLDFLLVENQVPMYILKNVVWELCKFDDHLAFKLRKSDNGLEWLVEKELKNVLFSAVCILLPLSSPTIVAKAKIFARLRRYVSETGASLMQWTSGKTNVSEDKLVKYLEQYYPPHTPHALEKCKHLLHCVYRVVCGHVQPPYKWGKEQLDDPSLESIPAQLNDPSLESIPAQLDDLSLESILAQLRNPPLESIPTAAQLEEMGIKAESSMRCTGNSVELTHGWRTWLFSARLKLPKVEIYDYTARRFRNLALYEQLLGQDINHYNSDLRCFLMCMHDLCKEKADLELLRKQGLINVHVRNDDAVSIWDKIMRGIEGPIPSHAWLERYNAIHRHCRSDWKQWRRKHCGMFFNPPWKSLSILAAIVLLIMTALQTWFTVVNSASSKERWPSRHD